MKAVALILALAFVAGKHVYHFTISSTGLHFTLPSLFVITCSVLLELNTVFPHVGCNARAMIPYPTQTNWEISVDQFWQYIATLNTKADGVVENIKASQISRELE